MLGVKPSYGTNFAQWPGMSEYPQLWRGLAVVYAPFLGMTGGRLLDWSGNGNHGILGTGAALPTWALGPDGPILSFDGGDYVACPDSPLLTPSKKLTIVTWLKENNGASTEVWISKEGSATNRSYYVRQYYYLGARYIDLVLSVDGSNFGNWRTAGNLHPVGEWFMLTIIVDTNDANPSIYVNDQLTSGSWSSGSMPSSIYDNTAQLTLGVRRLETAPTEYLTGLLGLSMLYGRNLSVSEIIQLYQMTRRLAG